jgi:hypothetical protein
MIFFLTTARHAKQIDWYLNGLGASVADRITPLAYEELFAADDVIRGTYCFGNLDGLSDDQRARAAAKWDELTALGCRVVNHPVQSMLRYELLRTCHDDGINHFTIHRLGSDEPYRYPVFLRRESDHEGSRSPLLHNRGELDEAIRAVEGSGAALDDYVVIEFFDTADEHGVYRKYGVFIVGDVVVARHLQASQEWQVKDAMILTREVLAEERDFIATNPHAEQVREVFTRARISYGRLDYSMFDGSMQVWEINTNPTIAFPPKSKHLSARAYRVGRWFWSSKQRHSTRRGRLRAPAHRMFAEQLAAAWTDLDRSDG